MMNFIELRNYIIENSNAFNGITFQAKDRNSKAVYPAVYLIEKPSTHDIISNNGLIIKYNEIGGGQTVRQFAVEIKILSKSLKDLITIRDALIDMLDFYRCPCRIARYKKFVLSNDGGAYFDDIANMYVNKLFFDVKLI